MFVEQPQSLLGAMSSLGSSQRRTRALADIVPSCGNLKSTMDGDTRIGGSLRMQAVTGGFEGRSRFPKLEECAHFHYDYVELGPIQVSLYDEEDLKPFSSLEGNSENCENKYLTVKVVSGGQTWLLRRTYDNFRMLDKQLHRCIYDRKFSALPELPHPIDNLQEKTEPEAYIRRLLARYLERLSHIAGSLINCGPVLSWLELDNRGHRLLVAGADNCLINTPAVAAAYAIKKYSAIAADEISFDVGDMISVIDMPPPEESAWWRGKKGFLVGFFPFHCVAVITDKVPRNLHLNQALSATEPSKPVLRKHGKLIAFFRAFILSRPSRRRLKQSGILRERVFGCDLGEHLLNSGHEIPMVLKCCAEFIEKYGLVDGIYRLSGVISNIQKLRTTFDEDRIPKLYDDEAILQDIHSVASLLKMYFRELPNPLCTYQLYHAFVTAVQQTDNNEKLSKMRETVQKLPPPHYRTLEYLMHHLARVADRGESTGMTARNVAIVWAPNLLRCKELEVGGVAALQVVGVQAVVTEFLIRYQHLIFTSNAYHLPPAHGTPKKSRPKSLAVSTPTRLLSLEEAQSRVLLGKSDQDYIEVGGGPSCLPGKYHTVIELPPRKRNGPKRSPLGWKSLFSRSSSSVTNSSRKSRSPSTCKSSDKRKSSIPSDIKFGHRNNETDTQLLEVKSNLRPVKSAESLTSGSAHNSARNSSCLETPPPRLPTTSPPAQPGHNRSSSHDSYFDHLAESTSEKLSHAFNENDEEGFSLSLDLSELQVNFELEESEMKIFAEDETNQLFGSPTIFEQTQNLKRQPMLALTEDSLSSDPSPKKHKTDSDNKGDLVTNNLSKKCRLEERLSSGELQYIDSQSPEQIIAHVDVHNGCDTLHSPLLAETTLSENESITLSMTPGTPRLNYTPLTEDSLSDANGLTPDHQLHKYSASSFHSPSSLEPNSRAESPSVAVYNSKNVQNNRHSYQDTSNSQLETLLPCSRLSYQGFLASPIEVSVNSSDSISNNQYQILENEKDLSIGEDSKRYSTTSNSESGLLSNTDSSSNDVSVVPTALGENVYENVQSSQQVSSAVIYENLNVENDCHIKYEPMDKSESESCYEDVYIGSKTPDKSQPQDSITNGCDEDVRLLREDSSSLNESLSSGSGQDLKTQSLVGFNIYDDVKEEIAYENVPDSKQLYQQVKYFKRSVSEINELLDHESGSTVEMTDKTSQKSVKMDTDSDDASNCKNTETNLEKPSDFENSSVCVESYQGNKESQKLEEETADLNFRQNVANRRESSSSRVDVSPNKNMALCGSENFSENIERQKTDEPQDTRQSNSGNAKNVIKLMSCFESSDDQSKKAVTKESAGEKTSSEENQRTDFVKPSVDTSSDEKVKVLSEFSRIPNLEKVPENESDLDRRKRIEKYKEERRMFLRQKYSWDNLRNKDKDESDVLRKYKQKADGNKDSIGELSELKTEAVSPTLKSEVDINNSSNKSKEDESFKFSSAENSSKISNFNHSRSSVLDKCLNLELKKSPTKQPGEDKAAVRGPVGFQRPSYRRSNSDNSGKLSPSRTMISICYSPTRKTISPEEEKALLPMELRDEIISVNDNKTTCVTIKQKEFGEEREKSSDTISKLGKPIGPSDFTSQRRNVRDFTASLERNKNRDRSLSTSDGCSDKQSLVAQLVTQLTGSSENDVMSQRRNVVSQQKQTSAGMNRQRAHSTSGRMTPYCIKDMAALFENPEELSKKS